MIPVRLLTNGTAAPKAAVPFLFLEARIQRRSEILYSGNVRHCGFGCRSLGKHSGKFTPNVLKSATNIHRMRSWLNDSACPAGQIATCFSMKTRRAITAAFTRLTRRANSHVLQFKT